MREAVGKKLEFGTFAPLPPRGRGQGEGEKRLGFYPSPSSLPVRQAGSPPRGRGEVFAKTVKLPFFVALLFSAGVLAAELDSERLSPLDQQRVDSILKKLGPAIEARKSAGNLPTLTFEDLYAPLDRDERKFLNELRSIGPERLGVKTPYLGFFEKGLDMIRLDNQTVKKEGIVTALDTQYVPRKVFHRYSAMMEAMHEDLGKRLYVASGYRSPAYQMYLFLFYLVKHSYSIRETALWNAFPGYSEHGDPRHQAIDFVNELGVDGEESVESFEALEEYRWLLKHAGAFGFVLSYPKGNPAGITFEPWHWRFAEEARAEWKKGV